MTRALFALLLLLGPPTAAQPTAAQPSAHTEPHAPPRAPLDYR